MGALEPPSARGGLGAEVEHGRGHDGGRPRRAGGRAGRQGAGPPQRRDPWRRRGRGVRRRSGRTRAKIQRRPGMSRALAIDLGTANTLVYVRGRGIQLRQPTVIALNEGTGEIMALGDEAYAMIGRTPGHIVPVRPLRGGAISDFETTARLIRMLLQRACRGRVSRPRVVVCVPSAITQVERKAVQEATLHAGARMAYLMEEP